MTQFEQDKQAAQDAVLTEQSYKAYRAFIERHAEIPDGMATEKLFREYADWSDGLTEADFEFALSNLHSCLPKRRVATPEEVKAVLIDKICELIASKNEGRDGKFDRFALASERKKLAFQSIEQLTQRLDEVVRKQIHAGKTVLELRNQLAEARRDTRRYPGYPDLPAEVVPDGKVRAIRCDAAFLKNLDPATLRRYVQRFGIQQINDAIRERV